MVDFAGWDMPVQYTSIIEEHQAVRTAAGLFDISHMGRLSFARPGRPALIQHVYTNNAATMKEGQVRYGLVCNERRHPRRRAGLSLALRLRHGGQRLQPAKIVVLAGRAQGGRNVEVGDQTTADLHGGRAGAAGPGNAAAG